jgi:dipeptidase E
MAAHHPHCRATHLPLFEQKGNRAEQIAAADVIYVGGGNTFNMLTLWKAWGVDSSAAPRPMSAAR